MKKLHSKSAFTFIEVLLVTALISIVGIAIFNSFSSGLKLWDRADRFSSEEDVAILFDKFGQDIRQTFQFSKIKFKGTTRYFYFPTFVWIPADVNSSRAAEEFIEQMGQVEYKYDPYERTITRSQSGYSGALKEEWEKSDIVARDIDDMEFQYYYTGNEGYIPQTVDALPAGIYLEVTFRDQAGGERRLFRYFPVPVGS